MTFFAGKTSAQLDGIEAETEQSGFSEQDLHSTVEDVKLKTVIDASGVSHICSARMTTFAPSRSSIGLTIGVLKLEVRSLPHSVTVSSAVIASSPTACFFSRPSAPAAALRFHSGCHH